MAKIKKRPRHIATYEPPALPDTHPHIPVGYPDDAMPAGTSENYALLLRAEKIIDDNLMTFIDVFNALKTINDGRLYKLLNNPATNEPYKTFGEYIACRFDFGRSYYSLLHKACEARESLCEAYGFEAEAVLAKLPKSVNFYRQLAKVRPEMRRQVVDEAINELREDGGIVATSRICEHAKRGNAFSTTASQQGTNIKRRLDQLRRLLQDRELIKYLKTKDEELVELERTFKSLVSEVSSGAQI